LVVVLTSDGVLVVLVVATEIGVVLLTSEGDEDASDVAVDVVAVGGVSVVLVAAELEAELLVSSVRSGSTGISSV
jgi:hypothetical protein